jgi:hypothetical protein
VWQGIEGGRGDLEGGNEGRRGADERAMEVSTRIYVCEMEREESCVFG